MKKKLFTFGLCLCMTIFALTGCTKTDVVPSDSTKLEDATENSTIGKQEFPNKADKETIKAVVGGAKTGIEHGSAIKQEVEPRDDVETMNGAEDGAKEGAKAGEKSVDDTTDEHKIDTKKISKNRLKDNLPEKVAPEKKD